METKRVSARLQLKAGDQGLVSAVVSTFNVVDSDRDIVLATAFTHGQEVPMTWAHNWAMPVGKGRLVVEPEQAVFNGGFFLSTIAGQEAFETVRAMEALQEWSWGFQVLDAAMEERNGEVVRIIKRAEIFEVSPVLVGAGVGTYTRDIKSDEKPYSGEHACRLRTPDDFQAGSFRRTSRESEGKRYDVIVGKLKGESSITEQAYRYPTEIWTESQAKTHCTDHDGLSFDPAIEEVSQRGMPYADQAETVLAAVQAWVARSKSLANLRLKEGRVLSEANRKRLANLHGALVEVANEIQDLLDSTEPPEKSAINLYVEYQRTLARLAGVTV